MDPYLEDRNFWRGFHHHLAEFIHDFLNQTLSARYYADIEIRIVQEEIGISTTSRYPDVSIVERRPYASQAVAVAAPASPIKREVIIPGESKLRSVRVLTVEDHRLVTAIEILSPINKRGVELKKYRRKRSNILQASVHLVEIDLLRGGTRPGVELNEPPLETDYVLLVNRVSNGFTRESEIWPVALNEPLPNLPIPLLAPDPDVILDMHTALATIYDRARYALRMDYTQPVPSPGLRPEMLAWLDEFKPFDIISP
jgi:hypothetical protein